MYSRWRLLSLLRNARLAPAGRLAAEPSLRSFGPPHAAATSAVVLGLSSNFVLAQDDLVAPVQQLQGKLNEVEKLFKAALLDPHAASAVNNLHSTLHSLVKGQRQCSETRDDPELDSMLKNRLRWGDPMAHVVKVVPQNVSPHSWLEHGVDHSNGYKDMYKLKNDNQATEQDAYVWSVADM
ncbi:hypothetical protein D1007_53314 [Hordeum vulgare]|nr:hypothetical protein D1007_53314 [Hordeum vulgare]